MNVIKQKRKEAGLTQEALGKLIGVAGNTISYYENGSRKPDITKLPKLSKILNCPIEDLIKDFDEK